MFHDFSSVSVQALTIPNPRSQFTPFPKACVFLYDNIMQNSDPCFTGVKFVLRAAIE